MFKTSTIKNDDKSPGEIRTYFSTTTEAGRELLSQFLQLDPRKRISCADALKHKFLTTEEPLACKPEEMPKWESSHKAMRLLFFFFFFSFFLLSFFFIFMF